MATQREFCQHYDVRRLPSSKTIKSIVVKFKTKGSVLNQQKGASGRLKEFCTIENIETVRLSVTEDPAKSYRKCAQSLNMKQTSLLTTLRKVLKFVPY